MAEKALVVQGGRLIDGTGRPPIENSFSFIEAGFQAVGRLGEVSIPIGAQRSSPKADGSPGCIDGHGHLEDFPENFTSIWELRPAPISNSTRTAHDPGAKNRAPSGKNSRAAELDVGRAIGGVGPGTMHSLADSPRQLIVTAPEEVLKAVRRKKEFGCDILKVNEFLSLDLVKVAVDEAHRLDMPVAAHSWDVVGSVNAGVDSIEHIWSVGYSSIPYAPARHWPRIG